jgi:hypothetical protein
VYFYIHIQKRNSDKEWMSLQSQRASSISGVFQLNFPTLTTSQLTKENYEVYYNIEIHLQKSTDHNFGGMILRIY